jgi:hypothetical protein
MGATKKPGAQATRRAQKSCVALRSTPDEIADHRPAEQPKIPSRAVLAQRFPSLKVNRLSWRWCDDRTGQRGDDLASLSRYLGEARR